MKLAIDSTVFVAALSGKDAHGPQAQALLRAVNDGEHLAITPGLALSEVIAIANNSQKLDIPAFFELIHNLEVIAVDAAAWVRAAELRQGNNNEISLAEAVYIAVALDHKVDCFMTNDYQFARRASSYVRTELLADQS